MTHAGPPLNNSISCNPVLLIALALVLGLHATADAWWDNRHPIHEAIQSIGMLLILVSIFGWVFASNALATHRATDLLDQGLYSITRNPFYALSIAIVAGAGALSGSVTIAIAAATVAFLIFSVIAAREEQALISQYGNRYRDYVARVPRLIPDPWLWRSDTIIKVLAPQVRTTFLRASLLLALLPLMEGIEYLRNIGLFPLLMRLP